MVHRITPIEGNLVDLLNKTSGNSTCTGFIKVDGYVFPERYKKFADAIENFEVRDDDIWVCSFPKAGTTWTQEMVWCIANDLDYEQAKVLLNERFPFFEMCTMFELMDAMQRNSDIELPRRVIDSIRCVEDLSNPRFIKTHLPFNLLPRQLRTGEKKAKIIHVARNAKDSCISYYHHSKYIDDFKGSFEDFCNLFIENMVVYSPFLDHALSYWERSVDENVLCINYEDMKKDLPAIIKKTATFLGKSLTSDQLSTLAEHLSFARMKVNPAVNKEELKLFLQKFTSIKVDGEFMRVGTTEQWRTVMSPEIINRFDNWTREGLKGTFQYI